MLHSKHIKSCITGHFVDPTSRASAGHNHFTASQQKSKTQSRVFTQFVLYWQKKGDCTVSTVDCKSSVDPSPPPPQDTFLLAWLNGTVQIAWSHLPTVNLASRQDRWKQLAEGGERERLVTNMWTRVAVRATSVKAWSGNRQKKDVAVMNTKSVRDQTKHRRPVGLVLFSPGGSSVETSTELILSTFASVCVCVCELIPVTTVQDAAMNP